FDDNIHFDITLQDSTTPFDTAATILILTGVVKGPGGLVKTGVGGLVLIGTANNTYTGTTLVLGGALGLNMAPGTDAFLGPLTIGTSVDVGQVEVLASEQIPDNVPVTITNGGLSLIDNGFTETLGPVTLADGGEINTGDGTVILQGGLTSSGTSNTISGHLA